MYCKGTADILDAHGCGGDTHVFIYTHTLPSAADSLRQRDGTQCAGPALTHHLTTVSCWWQVILVPDNIFRGQYFLSLISRSCECCTTSDISMPILLKHIVEHFTTKWLLCFMFFCTLTMLKYLCINPGDQRGFQFKIIINVLVISFCFI